MDAVEVMVHPEEVMVTYEPILGAATFQVEGYMVHGRFRGESLTPFFYDDDVPLEYQLDIAQRMEQLAAAQLRDVKPFVTFRCRSEWIRGKSLWFARTPECGALSAPEPGPQ